MSNKHRKKFKLSNHQTVSDLKSGKESALLEEADYTLPIMGRSQSWFSKLFSKFFSLGTEPEILQFKMLDEEVEKFKMESKVYHLTTENNRIVPKEVQVGGTRLLEKAFVTHKIQEEIDLFFKNLHVYDELGVTQKKRGMLLHSSPGAGKSSALGNAVRKYAENDNACVFIWPTNIIEPEPLKNFLMNYTDWQAIDKFILIIEDIGGFESIYSRGQDVTADILNFLDGIDLLFQKPTFIAATTNNIAKHNEALANRPGRFDVVFEIPDLSLDEIAEFYKFFAKDKHNLTVAEEKELCKISLGFTPAHIKEVYTRARLNFKEDVSLYEQLVKAANEIRKYVDDFKAGKVVTGKKPRSLGFFDD